MRRPEGSGWSSPSVILNIASLLMVIVGGYLALRRDDGAYLRDLDRRLTRIEAQVEFMRGHRDGGSR